MVSFSSGVLYTPLEGLPILCWACSHFAGCAISQACTMLLYGLLLSTSALLQSMPWPIVIACSASAEAAISPFLRARQCSLYIGQTGRSLKHWLKEHQRALNKCDVAASAFWVLVLGHQHMFKALPRRSKKQNQHVKGPFEKASNTPKYILFTSS